MEARSTDRNKTETEHADRADRVEGATERDRPVTWATAVSMPKAPQRDARPKNCLTD
jgi:hypothetical protein